MPVSVIVGGQYGSEGKGKVALHVAKHARARAVVRVGGSNSGHTAADQEGRLRTLRQLPASGLAGDCIVFLPAGSLIDPEILLAEIKELGLAPDRLVIDEMASVITDANKLSEANRDLRRRIGSTGSGTGAAVLDRIARDGLAILAKDVDALVPYTRPFVAGILRTLLDRGERILVEGTQGFGLSVWHSPHYPFATSRDTTASGFASEVGLSPRDIDDVVLVIRALPIRVGGNSGPLLNELTWAEVRREADLPPDFEELTSVTKRPRRIARFDPDIVKRAIAINNPHRIFLNHLDYVDPATRSGDLTSASIRFVVGTSSSIGRTIDWVGCGPMHLAVWPEPTSLAMTA
jgi:adenylosuccinate synthase